MALAAAAALLAAGGCGDVTVTADAQAGDDGGGAIEADAGREAAADDAGTQADAASQPDAQPVCDEGFTGAGCDECTVFVNGDEGSNSNAGLSWDDAVAGVDEGILRASNRLEAEELESCSVWVRHGVYTPGTQREDSFEMKPGVHLYGGFAGFEEARDARNWETNETVLSGALEGGENAYHVVVGSETLDGFTISGGRADGDDDHRFGGGMFNDDASPTVENAIFSDNQAERDGGAMLNRGDSAPAITNVTFSENQSNSFGGAMSNFSGSAPTITNATFTGNQAGSSGGAMRNILGSASTITNATFSNNQANTFGGAMSNLGSAQTITNAMFTGNQAEQGGAMFNSNTSALTITNVTFSANHADETGGAMSNGASAQVEIINSIIWANSAGVGEGEIDHDVRDSGLIAISYSIVDMQESDLNDSDGEVDVDFDRTDPEFADADLRLGAGSPAIDAGDSSVTDAENFRQVDLDGNSRVVGEAIDMGPYEFQD